MLLYAGLMAAGLGPIRLVATSSQPAFTSISSLPDGSIQLGMAGTTDSVYQLQVSSNWTGWTPLAVLTSVTSGFQFKDTPGPTNSQRFYRLQTAVGSNSVYWAKAQATHNYVVANLLTSYNSYRNNPGSNTAYEWYCVSQIYADEAMLLNGAAAYAPYMNNAKAFMNNFWDGGNPIGGYFAAVSINGTGAGGDKYTDDNALAGNVYLDCYGASSGITKTSYLDSAAATANWLTSSGQWDTTYGGGFWWSDRKTVKPTQSNGLALQLFLRLYKITGQTNYLNWANSVKNWLEGQMFDATDGLYIWQIETNGVKNYLKFTYDNAIMIEADLLYAQVVGDNSYLTKAETLANKLNARLWSKTNNVYYFNTGDGRVNPCWCGWASQSLIRLYEADRNPAWLDYAQQNIDFMNARLRNNTNGCYYVFCNADGSNVENRIEGVDQAWMQRIQAMMSAYR